MKKIELANKELEAFLRKEKVFTKYVKNATTKKIGGLGKAYLMEDCKLPISGSFNWASSPEDHYFWSKLDKEFTLNKK